MGLLLVRSRRIGGTVLRTRFLVAAGCGFAYFLPSFAVICIRKLLILLICLMIT